MFTSDERERYQGHFNVSGFGEEGQMKVKQSKVLIVGAGSLGNSVLQYLSAAGIGMIGVADEENISLTELYGEILFSEDEIGKSKAEIAISRARKLNKNCLYNCYPFELQERMASEMLPLYDVIVITTKNSPMLRLVDSIADRKQVPLVFGSVCGFGGEVSVFNFKDSHALHHYYPDGFSADLCKSSYMGFAAGVVGSLIAGEVVKVLTGKGVTLEGKKLLFNIHDLSLTIDELK
jgi:sulfur-carrier protein adenylyltransferase/sulfurtransferase